MKRKILIGIISGLGIIATLFQPLIIGLLALVVWVYLMWIVRKQKNNIFNDQIEPNIAQKLLKRLKVFLIVGGFSFLLFMIGAVVHNVLYGLTEVEEPVSFIIALVALFVFVLATVGALVIFLKGRQEIT